MRKRIAFKTLGCRLNQFETESLASRFSDKGYHIVDFADDADVYVVNTCTVTNQGDKKSRHVIHHVARKNPDSVLVVAGCMANSRKEQLENDNNISYVIPNEEKSSLYQIVDAHLNGEIFHKENVNKDVFAYGPTKKIYHTRSMVKIQDGCDNFCTFCIIPHVRGRAISRPVGDVLNNVRQNIESGYKEITLTGVNISRYQYEGIDFAGLTEKILRIPGDFRLRISSMEPDTLDDRFIDLFNHPKLCPHLHLCLQSGSDRILILMRRMYTVNEFTGIVNKLQSKNPDFNFTTDIMVGFPGETTEDFLETCRVIKDIGFSHIHTFKYSVRDKTRAARMKEQIPEPLKDERSQIIRDISFENQVKYRQRFIGKKQLVLPEKTLNEGFVKGYGENYLPITFSLQNHDFHTLVPVEITGMNRENAEMEGMELE